MRFTVAFILLVAVVAAMAYPAKDNKKPAVKKCNIECDDKEKIICARGNGLEIAFFNECIMRRSNCENNRDMQKHMDGYCPGNKNVRLS